MTIKKVFYKAPHNYDYDAESNECSVKEFGPSLTVQSQAEDVDINVIMKRFGVTGKMPENFPNMMYGDFDQPFDFRAAQEAVIAGQRAFDSLPWEIKDRFAQDPQKLLDFVQNPANIDEARKLGLMKEVSNVGVAKNAGGADSAAGAGAGEVSQAAGGSGQGGAAAKPAGAAVKS